MSIATSKKSLQKETVLSWLDLVVSGKIREAYDKYFHPQFRHHNQYFKGDRATLMKGMEESDKEFPNKVFEVKKLMEEGDTVMTFSSMKLAPGKSEIAVVHIFRFQDTKIIEMWDIGQEILKDSPNENGVF